MRILYISNSASLTGAPRMLLTICRGMQSAGHDVAVISPSCGGPLADELKAAGIRVFDDADYRMTVWPGLVNPIKFCRRMYYLLWGVNKARKYVGDVMDLFHPDIVHTNVGPLDLALDECRRRGIPHVWHLREFGVGGIGMGAFPSRRKFLERLHDSYNNCIAISSCIADNWGLGTIIYDGVFSREETFAEHLPVPGMGKYILYVGRIERAKGLLDTLKAFRKARIEDCRIVAVGQPCGFYAMICRAYASLFLPGKVTFTGVRRDVLSLMAGARALDVPSHREGFGLTVAEAMMVGCPVLGRDVAGVKEQMDACHGEEIALRWDSRKSHIAALRTVVTSDMSHMVSRAATVARDSYTSEKSISSLESFYKGLLK